MEILEIIKRRRSIRKYKAIPIDKKTVRSVLEAANWAPSNGNSQPWEFVVVQGEYKEEICSVFYEYAKGYIPSATYINEEDKSRMLHYAKDFGGAPCHIVVTYPKDPDPCKREEAMQACCAAIQNMLLQAESMGLGTVWISAPLKDSEKVKSIVSLSDDRMIAGIIPLGYPDIHPMAPSRKDPDMQEKVSWLGF